MNTASARPRRFLSIAAFSIFALPAIAAAGDKALAESLFQEGRRLLDRGKPQQACEKFAASQAQDPSPGTLLNLGKCHEAIGKTATAWADYKEAEALAHNLARAEQEKMALQRASTIEPRLSRLRIDPPAHEIEGLIVERGGLALSRQALGVDAPIDPGEYTIEARAPGREGWRSTVTIGPRAERAAVSIPDLKPSPRTPVAELAPAPPSPATPASSEAALAVTPRSPARTIGWALVGVGGAALIGGSVMGVLTLRQRSDAEDDPNLCPNHACSSAGREAIDSARSKATWANVGIGVGVAAAGAGLALVLLGRPRETETASSRGPSASVVPLVGAENGLLLRGAF